MVTKNFKALLKMILQSCTKGAANDSLGGAEAKDVSGATVYVASKSEISTTSYPAHPVMTPTLTATGAGISVGTGTTDASEDDWQLEATITSGLSLALSAVDLGIDANGDPYIEYTITATNTSGADITVGEIGYKQGVTCRTEQGWNAGGQMSKGLLLDRTVLDSPLTIPAGMSGVIVYRLKTEI